MLRLPAEFEAVQRNRRFCSRRCWDLKRRGPNKRIPVLSVEQCLHQRARVISRWKGHIKPPPIVRNPRGSEAYREQMRENALMRWGQKYWGEKAAGQLQRTYRNSPEALEWIRAHASELGKAAAIYNDKVSLLLQQGYLKRERKFKV